MKRLICLFLIALSAISCSVGDDTGTRFIVYPVQDIAMASAYKVDSISQIQITYKRPSDCHIFNGFYYDIDGFTRTVAVQFAKLNEPGCMPDETTFEIPLNFKPTEPGTYVFRFWRGKDSNGEDIYVETEAVVEE